LGILPPAVQPRTLLARARSLHTTRPPPPPPPHRARRWLAPCAQVLRLQDVALHGAGLRAQACWPDLHALPALRELEVNAMQLLRSSVRRMSCHAIAQLDAMRLLS